MDLGCGVSRHRKMHEKGRNDPLYIYIENRDFVIYLIEKPSETQSDVVEVET